MSQHFERFEGSPEQFWEQRATQALKDLEAAQAETEALKRRQQPMTGNEMARERGRRMARSVKDFVERIGPASCRERCSSQASRCAWRRRWPLQAPQVRCATRASGNKPASRIKSGPALRPRAACGIATKLRPRGLARAGIGSPPSSAAVTPARDPDREEPLTMMTARDLAALRIAVRDAARTALIERNIIAQMQPFLVGAATAPREMWLAKARALATNYVRLEQATDDGSPRN
jgi:hypothetical protein